MMRKNSEFRLWHAFPALLLAALSLGLVENRTVRESAGALEPVAANRAAAIPADSSLPVGNGSPDSGAGVDPPADSALSDASRASDPRPRSERFDPVGGSWAHFAGPIHSPSPGGWFPPRRSARVDLPRAAGRGARAPPCLA